MNIKSLFLALLVACTGISFADEMKLISPHEVAEKMGYISGKKNPDWYLINVLPHYVCADCTIPDSYCIPVHILAKKLKDSQKWPRNRKIIIHCADESCPLARYAYENLKTLGFDDLYVMKGGLAAWKKASYPVRGKCLAHYLKA